MSEPTAAQSGVLDQLVEQYGEQHEIAEAEGGWVFRCDGQELLIAEDGAITELETSAGLTGAGEETASVPPEADNTQEELGGAPVTPAPPAPTSLDIAQVSVAPEMVAALTAADERQIQAELEGRALGSMVYSFKQGGSTVTGLSYKGIFEAVRQVNTRKKGHIKIAAEPAPKFEEITVDADTGRTDDTGQPITEARRAVRCTVYAIDEMYGSARFGTAIQMREQKLTKKDKAGNPLYKPDPFADAKALSKASRNALEGMLPLLLVEELKANYLGQKSVEYISGTAVDITEQPPALTDERATKLGDEIRALYETFKRTHPEGKLALTPGEFGRYFAGAQHDHDRLEDFKSYMVEQVEAAEKLAEGAAA